MSNDQNPLEEWNRLERENTENAMVSSMFRAGVKTSSAIDEFSTWLLVGSAAIGAFLIGNADKFIPIICKTGFVVCGSLLCVSCLFGLISKIYGILCRVELDTSDAVTETFHQHLQKYSEIEGEIQETAKISGITIETGIRIERIMSEFMRPMPSLIKWMIKRQLQKSQGDPQAGYFQLVQRFNKQGLCALLQALSFLAFMASGVFYAAQI